MAPRPVAILDLSSASARTSAVDQSLPGQPQGRTRESPIGGTATLAERAGTGRPATGGC